MIELLPVEEAVGLPLAHDITEIRPGEFKGPAFRRGHVLKESEVEHMRRLGKNRLFVIHLESNEMHEDEAAATIAKALCGEGVGWEGAPREGKITLKATRDGLLKVDVDALTRFNALGDLMCATRHTNTVVVRGQDIGATRAIPLLIRKTRVEKAVRICRQSLGVLRVFHLKHVKVGVLITGTEVYEGRIPDRFEPIIRRKVESLGGLIMDVFFLPDDEERIAKEALDLVARGADIIITTGGMSVDPDDRTRFALKKAGAKEMLYGSPVLPGAMFMVTYLNGIPVLGIPACGLFAKTTVFDLIYPRILVGERISRQDLAKLGHGGYCLHCEVCRYPDCSFGKST